MKVIAGYSVFMVCGNGIITDMKVYNVMGSKCPPKLRNAGGFARSGKRALVEVD